jgi:hypothetical protein
MTGHTEEGCRDIPDVHRAARDRPAAHRPDSAAAERGWRRTTLLAHIVSAGAWIGIDVIVAVLVLAGWFADDVTVRGLADKELATFVVRPMLTAGLVSLATGLLLGLGSSYGCSGTGGWPSSGP